MRILSAVFVLVASCNRAPVEIGPTMIVPGDFKIQAATSDGWIIVKTDAGVLSAISITDGSTKAILTDDKLEFIPVVGPVVFIFHHVASGGPWPLTVWTAASGAHDVSTGSAIFSATPDGKYIAYTDHYDRASGASDLIVDTTDHTGPHVVSLCASSGWDARFVGGRLIAACYAKGATVATIRSFDPATGSGIDLLAPSTGSFAADQKNARIVTATPTGAASIVPVGGGASIPLVGSGFKDGFFIADGGSLLFNDTVMGLNRIDIGGKPVPLQNPVGQSWVASPGGQFVLYYVGPDNSPNDVLFLASTTQARPATTLTSPFGASIFSCGFTDDSRYAVYHANGGRLMATPTTDAGMPRLLATGQHDWSALDGSRIVFGETNGPVYTVDLQSTSSPTMLLAEARGWRLAPDHTSVLFTLADGLYQKQLP